jgi:C1A family cysteine protease
MSDITQEVNLGRAMGWLPDFPDFRDYTAETSEVRAQLKKEGQEPIKDMLTHIGLTPKAKPKASSEADLCQWCSPVEQQGSLGSCTANAGVGMVEYYERRAFHQHIDASRLFLYKTTRNLLGVTGDTGAYLRSTMASMVLFGVPPERYWPYEVARFDEEPTAFCYAFAQNYQSLQYFRLDPPGTTTDALLARIKQFLTAGLPSMFGFTVYSSIDQAASGGKIPFPCPRDRHIGGHAVMAVGFNDEMTIQNQNCTEAKSTGALMIRNSWGADWGDGGYGWLPYDYVTKGLAIDWWTLLKSEWVATQNFGL